MIFPLRARRSRAAAFILHPSAFILCLLAAQAAAQEPLTLPAAIEDALRRRPLLAADAQRIAAAEARVSQARAGLLPRIDFQASATDGPLGAPPLGLGGLVGTPIKKHTGASVNLVQTLLDFGRTHNAVRARRAEVSASREALETDRNRVTLEVQQAYIQALMARRLAEVNRQILEQRRVVARQAATLQQNGLASRVDVDLAEVAVSQAQLALVRAQGDVQTAFAALSMAVGRPLAPTTELRDDLNLQPSTFNLQPLDSVVEAALRQRPELRQAAAQVQAFDHLASAARSGKRPLLTGVASGGKINPVPLFESSDKPWAVGVALTVPLFTGGLVEGQVEEARRNAAAARENLNELSNAVRQQVTAAAANFAAAEEAIHVAETQRARAQDALSLATQRYQAQLGSIIELSQAQVAFATAENDLIRAHYDRELARAAFAYATGGQTPPRVGGPGGPR